MNTRLRQLCHPGRRANPSIRAAIALACLLAALTVGVLGIGTGNNGSDSTALASIPSNEPALNLPQGLAQVPGPSLPLENWSSPIAISNDTPDEYDNTPSI